MNGYDISNHQKNISVSKVASDFVIIKATQGTTYTSPSFEKQIKESISAGRLVGVYHYASTGGAIPEAEHFLSVVGPYVGTAILCLDWEGQDNPNFSNPSYAMAFLRYVEQKTGIKPFIYMSKTVCRQYKSVWDPSYPLWCAQYANYQYTGYKTNPWTDSYGYGPWKDCKIFQYSSRGRLPGYSKDLDLDLAYLTPEQWMGFAKGTASYEPIPQELPILKKGSKGEYVRNWQLFLNLNGYACGNPDGIFGPKTEAAVRNWQKDHGLVPDGIIGPKTWGTIIH